MTHCSINSSSVALFLVALVQCADLKPSFMFWMPCKNLRLVGPDRNQRLIIIGPFSPPCEPTISHPQFMHGSGSPLKFFLTERLLSRDGRSYLTPVQLRCYRGFWKDALLSLAKGFTPFTSVASLLGDISRWISSSLERRCITNKRSWKPLESRCTFSELLPVHCSSLWCGKPLSKLSWFSHFLLLRWCLASGQRGS